MKRFPSSRCAVTMQIVRSKAETQSRLQPDALSLSAIISQYRTRSSARLLLVQSRLRCGFAQFKPCAHFL